MNQLDWVYESYHQSRSRVGGEWEESVLFLLQLLNVLDQQSDGEHEPHLDESRQLRHAEKMMHWIEEHCIDEIRLDHMADGIRLSKSYASRIFQQETGSSTTDYVSKLIFCWKRRLCPLKRLAGRRDFPMDLISFNYFTNRREPLRYSVGSILNTAADIKSHKDND